MSCPTEQLSSESCSGYENPSEETPCRFESGPGHNLQRDDTLAVEDGGGEILIRRRPDD